MPLLHKFYLLLVLPMIANVALAQASPPRGEVEGSAVVHDETSSIAVVDGAQVALPASVTGGDVYVGSYLNLPKSLRGRAPVVVFLHGSSGLSLKAIEEWQRWLAGLGIASFAPDSFGLRGRITYKSPVDKDVYEKVHALRASEISIALRELGSAPWVDTGRMVLAGTSEGGTEVARYSGGAFLGRIIYSWSCETNYFVRAHATAATDGMPVLNVISASDPYFSPSNPWLGNPGAKGHCAEALKTNKKAAIVVIPDAPHTLINWPAARYATEGFLWETLGH